MKRNLGRMKKLAADKKASLIGKGACAVELSTEEAMVGARVICLPSPCLPAKNPAEIQASLCVSGSQVDSLMAHTPLD